MVKALVAKSFRLKLGSLPGTKDKEEFQDRLKDIADMYRIDALDEEEEDDIYVINVLRMMATPAYIFSCYSVAADGADIDGDSSSQCDCSVRKAESVSEQQRSRIRTPPALLSSSVPRWISFDSRFDEGAESGGGAFEKYGRKRSKSNYSFHYCPGNDKFMPRDNCPLHLECNDPIYRCFDLAQLAYWCSKEWPEYRTECMEIVHNCRRLSAEILGRCRNSREVALLLEEKAASKKYFLEFTSSIKFPRVRLAVEHSHKEFATHMYCQQFLRREWHGHVQWQGKPALFKLLYFAAQVLLTPLFAVHACFVEVGRDLKDLRGGELPHPNSASSWIQRTYFKYLHYCASKTVNLDSPLNRCAGSHRIA